MDSAVGPDAARATQAALKDLNVTKDEFAKLEAAFQKPEFLQLFHQYVEEISNPKAREENDKYLRQLEAEGRAEEIYGAGVELIVPDAWFALKTINTKTKEKLFINMCTSPKVAAMAFEDTKGTNGKMGTSMKIPMTYNKEGKPGTDKHGNKCLVWDVAVHSGCIGMLVDRPQLMPVLTEMVIENLEQAAGVQLSRNAKPLKMKYKATPGQDKPRVLSIRRKQGSLPQSSASSAAGGAADLKAKAPTAAKASRSTFSFPKPNAPKAKPAIAQPEYQVIHRGVMDLTDAWGDVGRTLQGSTLLPKELVVRVELPGVVSAASIQLNLTDKTLQLSVADTYELAAVLPYKVDTGKARAKFDQNKSRMEITLPVLPPPTPAESSKAQMAGQDFRASCCIQDMGEAAPGSTPHCTAEGLQLNDTCATNADQSTPSPGPHSAGGGTTAEQQLSENERKWLELHATSPAAATAAAAATPEQWPDGSTGRPVDSAGAAQTNVSADLAQGDTTDGRSGPATCNTGAASQQTTTPAAPIIVLKPRIASAFVAVLD